MRNNTRNTLLVFGVLIFAAVVAIAKNYFDDLPSIIINSYRNINY